MVAPQTPERRLLLVHAHPDDETINNGATMARYATGGALVTLVTCTRGELGEVIPPELAHLEGDGDALAEHRVAELAAAMRAVGISDHRFLGDAAGTRYRDSGMAYAPDGRAVAPAAMSSDAFARAGVDEAAAHLVPVLRDVRPQVLITYERGGGYGHPDHVQAHRVAMRAVQLAADPTYVATYGPEQAWQVAKVYWTVAPAERVLAGVRELRAAGVRTLDPDGPLPSMVVPAAEVTAVVDATDHLEAKVAALRAHATQVAVSDGTFALSNGVHQPLTGVEHYRLALGTPARDDGRPGSWETDLFAGLA